MKKHSFFSPSLYVEGLRQTRVIGILSLVLLELATVIPVIGEYISLERYGGELQNAVIIYPHGITVLGCVIVMAPLLTLYLFHFLNKRASCDFYHTLPYTRVSLYISFTAVVLTWMGILLLVPVASSLCLYQTLLRSYVTVSFASLWSSLFTVFAASLLVMAAALLAMGLTGTVFTNIVGTGLILFLPRFLLQLIQNVILENMAILNTAYMPFPFGSYNLVTAMVFNIFTSGETGLWNRIDSGIYTLCLAVLFFALGLWVFCRRKSEAAGQAAVSRGIQAVIRLCIGLTISVIPTLLIARNRLENATADKGDIFSFFVIYLVAVIAYLLYELLSTRKIGNLLKALPGLGILVLLNLAVFGVGLGLHESILRFTPETDEIRDVRILYDSDNYFTLKSNEVTVENETLRSVVSRSLKQGVQNIRQHNVTYGRYLYLPIAIRTTGGRTAYRDVPFTTDDMVMIQQTLKNQEDYRTIYTSLPSEKNVIVRGDVLTAAQATEVYRSLVEEIGEYDKERCYSLLFSANGIGDGEELEWKFLGNLYASAAVGSQSSQFRVPISTAYPKTATLYMRLCNENMDAAALVRALSDTAVDQYASLYTDVDLDGRWTAFRYGSDDPADTDRAEAFDAFVQWLRESSLSAPTATEPYAFLNGSADVFSADGKYYSYRIALYIPQENGKWPAFLDMWQALDNSDATPIIEEKILY